MQAAEGQSSGVLGGGAAWFSWPGVVAVAAASTALLHLLLDRLPRCFTLGVELQPGAVHVIHAWVYIGLDLQQASLKEIIQSRES